MLFTIVWVMILAAFILGRIKKKQKPPYVVEWDEKLKANQRAIKIQSISMPDTWFESEEEWNAHISKELAKLQK